MGAKFFNVFVCAYVELLRCYGESTLVDLVQLLFSQLPLFSEDEDTEVESSTPIDQVMPSQGRMG